MDREELIEYMQSKGFTLWAILGGIRYQFLSAHDNTKLPNGISCIINPETSTFEFKYRVPGSVFNLESGSMSPYTSNSHFTNILNRFAKIVNTLENEYGEE